MMIKAYAKINISLDVVGKKENGYHLLKMIMQNIDLYDVLHFKRVSKGIHLSCNKRYVPTDERNLVYKTAKLFLDQYGIEDGIKIDIVKNIPVSAGLAGGSTDAAATLRGLRDLYEIDCCDEKLKELGLAIGADVPYCITGGTALCEGIGEVITPLRPFKNYILVLVKPPFGVSTKEVYKDLEVEKIHIHPDTIGIMDAIEQEDIIRVSHKMKNVLENVTLRKHRVLKQIKSEMVKMGALNSLMSGSGPTIFGFFDDMLKAQRCYEKLREKYKEVFITRTI